MTASSVVLEASNLTAGTVRAEYLGAVGPGASYITAGLLDAGVLEATRGGHLVAHASTARVSEARAASGSRLVLVAPTLESPGLLLEVGGYLYLHASTLLSAPSISASGGGAVAVTARLGGPVSVEAAGVSGYVRLIGGQASLAVDAPGLAVVLQGVEAGPVVVRAGRLELAHSTLSGGVVEAVNATLRGAVVLEGVEARVSGVIDGRGATLTLARSTLEAGSVEGSPRVVLESSRLTSGSPLYLSALEAVGSTVESPGVHAASVSLESSRVDAYKLVAESLRAYNSTLATSFLSAFAMEAVNVTINSSAPGLDVVVAQGVLVESAILAESISFRDTTIALAGVSSDAGECRILGSTSLYVAGGAMACLGAPAWDSYAYAALEGGGNLSHAGAVLSLHRQAAGTALLASGEGGVLAWTPPGVEASLLIPLPDCGAEVAVYTYTSRGVEEAYTRPAGACRLEALHRGGLAVYVTVASTEAEGPGAPPETVTVTKTETVTETVTETLTDTVTRTAAVGPAAAVAATTPGKPATPSTEPQAPGEGGAWLRALVAGFLAGAAVAALASRARERR